jgi:hypothetical protein
MHIVYAHCLFARRHRLRFRVVAREVFPPRSKFSPCESPLCITEFQGRFGQRQHWNFFNCILPSLARQAKSAQPEGALDIKEVLAYL